MRKKSQMEVMGLVVIVILVSLVMLVVLVFMVKKPASTVTQDYYHSQLATNTINALLRTTARDCRGHDLTTLAKDCIENYDPGYDSTIVCEDGITNSCEYVALATEEILSSSLAQLHKKYILQIKDPNNEITLELKDPELPQTLTGGCPGRQEASNPQPLATDRGMMQIQLLLCLD